jgi:hypothetical protein
MIEQLQDKISRIKRWSLVDFIIMSLFLIFLILNQINNPNLFSNYYTHFVYKGLRLFYNYTLIHVPFAISYIVMPGLIFLLIRTIYKSIELLRHRSFSKAIFNFCKFAMCLYIGFYALWGFNYKGVNLTERINIDKSKVDTLRLISELQWTIRNLNQLRSQMTNDTNGLSIVHRPKDLTMQVSLVEQEFLASYGYPTDYKIKIRNLLPKGTLLRFSTAGIYNPFSLEGHYDDGLSHIHNPFVIAHEMAHGYGITDEGECNFVALVTTLSVKDKYINYTGLLTYYRYIASDLLESAPESFKELKRTVFAGTRNDLRDLYAALDKYPDIISIDFRDWIYDQYLKSNGVKVGINSYNQVVDMAFGYKEKYGLDSLAQF